MIYSEIREKLRSYYNAGVSASQLIKKSVIWFIPRTTIIIIKIKKTDSRKRRNGKPSLITKGIGTKIELHIKEDNTFRLEEIKQIIKDTRIIKLSNKQLVDI